MCALSVRMCVRPFIFSFQAALSRFRWLLLLCNVRQHIEWKTYKHIASFVKWMVSMLLLPGCLYVCCVCDDIIHADANPKCQIFCSIFSRSLSLSFLFSGSACVSSHIFHCLRCLVDINTISVKCPQRLEREKGPKAAVAVCWAPFCLLTPIPPPLFISAHFVGAGLLCVLWGFRDEHHLYLLWMRKGKEDAVANLDTNEFRCYTLRKRKRERARGERRDRIDEKYS